jgi:hypothetical protein
MSVGDVKFCTCGGFQIGKIENLSDIPVVPGMFTTVTTYANEDIRLLREALVEIRARASVGGVDELGKIQAIATKALEETQ